MDTEKSLVAKIMDQIENDTILISGNKTTVSADLLDYVSHDEIVRILQKEYNERFAKKKMEEYTEKLRQPTFPVFDSFESYNQHSLKIAANMASVENFIFSVQDYQKEIWNDLVAFFGGFDTELKNLRRDKKGIMFVGPLGIGKTFLMEVFRKNPVQSFVRYDARNLGKEIRSKGISRLEFFENWIPQPSSNDFFGQRQLALFIDDMGTEENIRDFGNEINIIQDIVLGRYQNLKRDQSPNLFITTNLEQKEVVSRYGERFMDRLREMMNVVVFEPTLKSLRK